MKVLDFFSILDTNVSNSFVKEAGKTEISETRMMIYDADFSKVYAMQNNGYKEITEIKMFTRGGSKK